MPLDIQFDQIELDKNTQQILQAATSEQATTLIDSFEIICKTAKEFKSKYQSMIQQISRYQSQLKHIINTWHDFKSNFAAQGEAFKETTQYDQYLRSRQKLKQQYFSNILNTNIIQTYQLAMKFQEYLNAAIGQKVTTAYVWVGARGIPETYLINDMSGFLKVDTDRYGNITVRYRNNASLLKQHSKKVQDSIKEDTAEFNYSLLKSTYKDIFDRYYAHKVRKGGAFVLWLYPHSSQKWNGVYVSSFGSINEAYATILLHQHFVATAIPEDNIEQFMSVVMGVTNLAGTLQGDTTVNNMEVAVKSAGATTLSIQQLYEISTTIVTEKLQNFNEIQEYLRKIKKQNKQAQQSINKSLKQALQNIGEDHLGSIIQNMFSNLT